MEEERASANSELRYIALELTKLAHQKKKTFKEIAGEYVQNVYLLETILRASPGKAKAKVAQRRKQRA
ncbi:MAG: hypothetical protein ABIH83_03470 [Candidatus Micrarchaeota archaeon]